MLNVHGWKEYIVKALDLLPADLRERLAVAASVIEPCECARCGLGWFRADLDGPVCHVCHPGLFGVGPVELLARCPQLAVVMGDLNLLRATLIKRGKAFYIILAARGFRQPCALGEPPTFFLEFRVGSAKKQNSADALQRAVREFVYPHLGLCTDRERAWGWPGGLRLDGTARVPDLLELIDLLEQQGGSDAPDPRCTNGGEPLVSAESTTEAGHR